MLWFVGLGVSGPRSMPAEALDALAGSDIAYLEAFTSPVSEQDVQAVREKAGGEFALARRWMVEDGAEILRRAKSGSVALVSYGDPYIATTHTELRTRAARDGIKTRTAHAASSLTSAVGECGLHYYKVGRIATVMGGDTSYLTPYDVAQKNMVEGNHTVLLLEYDQDGGFFLDPADALSKLLGAEDGQRRGVFTQETYAIVASRIGADDQAITAGTISSMAGASLGGPPHTLIIPGSLHFTESDALAVLARCLDPPRGNAAEKIAAQMLEKYVPMVREALAEVEPRCRGHGELDVVIENAKLYIKDAEEFLREGKDEVAVLAIGYADGLVDALRMAKGMDPKM